MTLVTTRKAVRQADGIYGWEKSLNLASPQVKGYAHGAGYLGGASVSDVSRAALDDAIAGLRKDQGDDPAKWRSPMPQIQFQSLDVASVPSMPWENRGTWGEAIALPGQ